MLSSIHGITIARMDSQQPELPIGDLHEITSVNIPAKVEEMISRLLTTELS